MICKKTKKTKEEKLEKKDMPYVVGMVVLDIIAPILLMIGLTITSSSNASSYISANYFYARPLISNNIAYILDDNMSLSGTYNSIKEIFTDEVTKKTYFMYCENELLDTNDTSKSEYQEKKINNSIVLTECIVDDVNHVIVSGENEYILYAGIYFKLTSRNYNTAVVNLTKLSTNTSVDYSLMTVKWDTTYNVWKIS